MEKRKNKEPYVGPMPTSEEERLKYVLDVLEEQIEFYQAEVIQKAWCYYVCTIVSLVGAAAVPVLVGVLQSGPALNKLWIALPGAIAALATAFNSTFGFKDDWITSYVTMNSLMDETDRFMVRAEQDYGIDKPLQVAMDTLVSRVSKIVMQETMQFQKRSLGAGHNHKRR
jgi:hypothetical protein